VPFETREITKLRINDPSLFPSANSNHTFGIRPSVPDRIHVVLAEALTQNTIVRRIMLQSQHYSKLSADGKAKYLIQSKRLLRVDLMVEPPPSFPISYPEGLLLVLLFSSVVSLRPLVRARLKSISA
jgi:hypothetical protein